MIGLDYTSTRLKVERGCRLAAGPEECSRVALVEYGKLTGRTFGGLLGGAAGSQVCLAVGVTPATLACALVVGGAGAYAGMKGGEPVGGLGGELIDNLTPEAGVPEAP